MSGAYTSGPSYGTSGRAVTTSASKENETRMVRVITAQTAWRRGPRVLVRETIFLARRICPVARGAHAAYEVFLQCPSLEAQALP